jgi:hypothetical protein
MPIPIFCGSCGARGSVAKVTAGLQCRCGSKDLGLDGVDPKPSRVASQHVAYPQGPHTGWGKPMPSPTRGWSDYAGPIPTTVPRTPPVSDSQVCPACNGSGYDTIDKTMCRECNGSGRIDGRHPTSAPGNDYLHPESYDATTNGPPSGGARWQGRQGVRIAPGSPEDVIRRSTPGFTAPPPTGEFNPNDAATFYPKSPHRSPAVQVREERNYDAPTGRPYLMDEAYCPNCGHAPTELAKDRNEDAWWRCPNCGPLANIDAHPEVNPYEPSQDFRPDRSMKTGSLFRRKANKRGGLRVLALLDSIHGANDVSAAEALTLARKTLITYGER